MGSGTGGLYTPEERLNYIDAFIKVNQQPIDLDFWQQEYKKSQGCTALTNHWQIKRLSVLLFGEVKPYKTRLDVLPDLRDIISKRGSAERDCHAGRVRAMPPAVN